MFDIINKSELSQKVFSVLQLRGFSTGRHRLDNGNTQVAAEFQIPGRLRLLPWNTPCFKPHKMLPDFQAFKSGFISKYVDTILECTLELKVGCRYFVSTTAK